MNIAKQYYLQLKSCAILSISFFTVCSIGCPAVSSLEQTNRSDGFTLPSRNIYCLYSPDETNMALRCDIASGLVPQPKAPCELDRTGIYLGKNTRAVPTCAGDTVAGNYPVLKYGRTWTQNGLKCTATTSGLTCKNSKNHGFFLSKQKWRVY